MMDAPCCIVCGKKASKLCSACHSTPYCSIEHQLAHWKEHEPNCCGHPYRIDGNANTAHYPVAQKDLKAATSEVQLTNQLKVSAVLVQNVKVDGKKAQKRERETAQGPSRESDETALEAMPYDPNYMTSRFCDSKNLVRTKIANKTKKSMSTTPYCAVRWGDEDDDDEDDDDQNIGKIAEQQFQPMSKNRRKKMRRAAAAAAASDVSMAKKSMSTGVNQTDQLKDQGNSMNMEQPTKTVTKVNKRMKKKKQARDAAAATGLTNDLGNLDV